MTAPAGSLLIDVSSLQGEIDWPRVAAWRSADGRRIVGVYARAALGATLDSRCARYLAGARAVGLLVGVYGVLVPGGDPVAQADALANTHVANGCDLPPSLDFELVGPHVVADAIAYVHRLEERTNRRALIYTGWGFMSRVGHAATLAADDLWDAHYTAADHPWLPADWGAWKLWQYSGNGGERIDGIACDVDRDVFAGDETALRAWIATTYLRDVAAVDPPIPTGSNAASEAAAADAYSPVASVPEPAA